MIKKKITIITGNQNKAHEFERLLGVELETVKIDLTEIQTTDVREVARAKAEEAYRQLGRPCFVDDTGLTIHEWGELPGALIKWFIDNVGNDGIINMMKNSKSRAATVTTALGYCDENGEQVFVGELSGTIADSQAGENGFGYDPIFIPEGHTQTFAEMNHAEKDMISMRSIAAEALKSTIIDQYT